MVYLDTSVAVALFVPEAKTAAITDWIAATDDTLVSSDWILAEFASALSIKERRGDLSAAAAQAVWDEFDAFCGTGLQLAAVGRAAFETAAHLARDASNGLRAGDSLHLSMALELGATRIATTDGVLASNARKRGLETVGF
jgi:predicted nucleic acid-binding protein